MKNIAWGLLLISLGLIFLITNLGLLPIGIDVLIHTYWPLLVVTFGIILILQHVLPPKRKRGIGHFFIPSLLIVSGLVLQGNRLDWFHGKTISLWHVLWPLVFIFMGLSVMISSSVVIVHKKNNNLKKDDISFDFNEPPTHFNNSFSNKTVLLGTLEIGKDPWVLEDKNINVGIGETLIDLSKAFIKEGETVLTLEGKVGSIVIMVPEGLAVDVYTNLKLGNIKIFNNDHSGTPGTVRYKSKSYDDAYKKVKIVAFLKVGEITLKRVD